MIINLRGTHGSGKSTIVQELLKKFKAQAIMSDFNHKKIFGYSFNIPGVKSPVFAVGSYATQCGGCDGIQPYALIWPRVESFIMSGHVIFEGALISTSIGSIGLELVRLKKYAVVAYLNTPTDVCLERIRERRALKGNTKPLNPTNTISKMGAIESTRHKFDTLGVRTVTLNYKKATKQVLELLYESH